MIKLSRASIHIACAAMLSAALCACGGAPAPSAVQAPAFQVISDTNDQSGRCLVMIKLQGSVSETQAGAAAESVINSRKSQCRSITVKSYLGDTGEAPYLISSLDGNGIKHEFAHQTDQKRIPTH